MSINQKLYYLGNYILCHSKRLLNNVIPEIVGCYSNKISYGDTDSAFVYKKHWSTLVEKVLVG